MDKNIKRSLVFGGIVGGLFALFRRVGNKTKLTDTQVKEINNAYNSYAKLHTAFSDHCDLVSLYTFIKEKFSTKKYDDILTYINDEIGIDDGITTLSRDFANDLDIVLSGQFTAERANAKSHQAQSFLMSYKDIPNLIDNLIDKRTEILSLVHKVLGYIKAGESTDFKSDDKILFQSLVKEFQALQKNVSNRLARIKR